jgi:hypothetical protein
MLIIPIMDTKRRAFQEEKNFPFSYLVSFFLSPFRVLQKNYLKSDAHEVYVLAFLLSLQCYFPLFSG